MLAATSVLIEQRYTICEFDGGFNVPPEWKALKNAFFYGFDFMESSNEGNIVEIHSIKEANWSVC